MPYNKKNPIKQLIEQGEMKSSISGSSNYMKEPGSAILNKKFGMKVGGGASSASAGTNPPKSPSAIGQGNTFYSAQSKLMSDPNETNTQTNNRAGDVVDKKTGLTDYGATNRRDMGITDKSKSNYNSMFQDGDGGSNKTAVEALSGSGTTPKPKKTTAKKVTKKVTKEEAKKEANVGPSAAQTAASKLEKRAKTAISKQKRKPKTEDGVNAVRDFQANKKKKGKEMSRGEIKEAKKKDKDSGMSRKEVRLNKTKRKAASTRAKTVSKETAAKGGKEAQRLARKTIRLEKKAAKIEGRVKASKIK